MSAAILTARAAGLVGCELCERAAPQGARVCGQCGARLPEHGRRPLSAVWAWLVAGIVLYIPANLQPMLVTQQFGKSYPSTIVGGAIELFSHGSYGIAAIVFFASVIIPVTKFLAIGRLALIASGRAPMAPERALKLYEVVEFIGRWSMIDVFVVAILTALVQLGFIARLEPGSAAALFALSVSFTMLSARAFDPRLIWDRVGSAHV